MKRFFLLFFAAAFISTSMAANYKYEHDINYRTDDDYATKMCRIDIATPEDAKDAPVIVWFHGGGLTSGHKDIPQQLLKGCVVVGVGYRFSPNVEVKQIVDDAASAVAWVFANIEKYGGSAKKIYISGHSAGGYLVSMISLDKSYLQKYNIDANSLAGVIPFSGQVITHFEERRTRGMSDKHPLVDNLAPLYHVRGDAPAMLLLLGDRELEMLGRYEENAYFWRMLRIAGHKDVTLYEFDGYGHNMCEPGYPQLLRFIREREQRRNAQ